MNRRSGKNPARKRIGRLMPQLRAAPDLHASRPKPHLATGQRQGHPDEVGPLEARGPTSSKLRAAEKNSEPRKIFSEPRSLGEPFSSFYRDTSEYAFCRNPIPYTGATALSSRAAWSAPRQHLRTPQQRPTHQCHDGRSTTDAKPCDTPARLKQPGGAACYTAMPLCTTANPYAST